MRKSLQTDAAAIPIAPVAVTAAAPSNTGAGAEADATEDATASPFDVVDACAEIALVLTDDLIEASTKPAAFTSGGDEERVPSIYAVMILCSSGVMLTSDGRLLVMPSMPRCEHEL